MCSLTLGSVNCRGLSSDQVRRRDIFSKCRDNYDITFLIDTHSSPELEKYWRNEWGYEARCSSFSTNSRGVAILFKNTFEFDIKEELYDLEGNFIMLDLIIQNQRILLVALYGPNSDSPSFYEKLFHEIEINSNISIIMGGDWNISQKYTLDTLNYKTKNNQNAQTTLHNLMREYDLVDVWREINPTEN